MNDESRFIEIMTEVYKDLPRQGPGSAQSTLKALQACNNLGDKATVLDLGCGAGTHSITLAKNINGTITAIDFMESFVDVVRSKAEQENLSHKIQAQVGDMSALDVQVQSIDLIWAEASAYSIGFANALAYWHQFLISDGYLAVSELVWLKHDRPQELQQFWDAEYPDMKHVDEVTSLFAQNGYQIVEKFTFPEDDWKLYYDPQKANIASLREKYSGDEQALAIVQGIEVEIQMRERFAEWYGYTFFVAKKV